MKSFVSHSNMLCDFQKHVWWQFYAIRFWCTKTQLGLQQFADENPGEAHIFEADLHGRTSKGLVGHVWKGVFGSVFSVKHKPHKKENQALAYSNDWKSDKPL